VVDDEAPMRRALAVNLKARGFDVDSATTGEEALSLASARHPAVVLLDLGLPGIGGLEVIVGLRGWTSVPILILSARGSESDKVTALDAGADDYVTKPFGIDELLARLRAAVRRFQPPEEEVVVDTPHFVMHLLDKSVRGPSGADIRLTPIEWQIAEALVRHPGRLITQRRLIEQVWGTPDADSKALRVHLTHIRQKLEPDPALPRYFITETGMGYRFVPRP